MASASGTSAQQILVLFVAIEQERQLMTVDDDYEEPLLTVVEVSTLHHVVYCYSSCSGPCLAPSVLRSKVRLFTYQPTQYR